MSIQQKFDRAVEIVGGLPKHGTIKPTDEQQLVLYKYYKQVTVGDVNTSRPGMFDLTGKAKWDAWESVKGTPKETAQQAYVDQLLEILKGVDTENWTAELK